MVNWLPAHSCLEQPLRSSDQASPSDPEQSRISFFLYIRCLLTPYGFHWPELSMREMMRRRGIKKWNGRESESKREAEENTVALKGQKQPVQHICKHAAAVANSRTKAHAHTHEHRCLSVDYVCKCVLEAVMLCGLSSISWCHTGMSVALEQWVSVALWDYYMVYQSLTNNLDQIIQFPPPLHISTWNRNRPFLLSTLTSFLLLQTLSSSHLTTCLLNW